jgi:hypothetical protein
MDTLLENMITVQNVMKKFDIMEKNKIQKREKSILQNREKIFHSLILSFLFNEGGEKKETN